MQPTTVAACFCVSLHPVLHLIKAPVLGCDQVAIEKYSNPLKLLSCLCSMHWLIIDLAFEALADQFSFSLV